MSTQPRLPQQPTISTGKGQTQEHLALSWDAQLQSGHWTNRRTTATTADRAPGGARRRGEPATGGEPEKLLAGPVAEGLRREIEELGLSSYEAAVLLALLQVGSATTLQIARLSRVPRTSTYQVLEDLHAKQLAERVPGEGIAVWASPGRQIVFDRLEAAFEERLRQHRARSARVQETLAEALPEGPSVTLPYVHLLHGVAQVKRVYEQMLREAESELMMFTRGPFSWKLGTPNPVVLETLARGIRARVIYRSLEWHDPAGTGFRTEMEAYHQAGVQARLAEDLPMKLTIVDRRVVLVVITAATSIDAVYPTTLHVENAAFGAVQSDAFEHRWEASRPFTPETAAAGKATGRSPAPSPGD
ncbi:MAG: hypothetical protein CYG61_04715 [Actinobacteria bacterium]|nr:MAG: hypothetical protein CYG61_04715 [Actinomycetota bacterium]